MGNLLSEYRKSLSVLRLETLLILQDPEGERWAPDRVDEALNDTALEWALENEQIREELNVQLLENVYIYDIKKRVEEDGTLRPFAFPLRVGYCGKTQPAFTPVTLFDIDMMGYDQNVWYRNNLSPGKIAVIPPSEDGAAAGSADPYDKNIQVLYAAMPTYMTADGDYPDTSIPAMFHQALPHGAASRLLDEGDADDLVEAVRQEEVFKGWIGRARREIARGTTDYGGARPL
jgi:hypothetical protein